MAVPGDRESASGLRPASALLHERPRSLALGLAAVVAAVAIETALIYPLRQITPAASNGVVYMLGVLLISTYWGLGLGLLTSVASAAAFNFFHIPPTGKFTIAEPQNWVALGVFLVAAATASTLAELARARAREAERRREEADLAAEMARLLLGSADLPEALVEAGRRLAGALGLPWAGIELSEDDPGRNLALPLVVGPGRAATLIVPRTIEPEALDRLRTRILPSLEALVRAGLDREALQAEVVETKALRRSDSVKTALLRAVSHDLRTPLTTIVTAGEAVRSPSVSAAERDELGQSIAAQAERLSSLVEKLLDLSRIEAGTAPPRRDWCSIDEVVRAAADDVRTVRDSEIKLSIDDDLPLINADAAQLERAFANLLENAERHSSGQPVQVRARAANGRIGVRVVDRGPGIPTSELPRIFEPFYRLDDHGGQGGSGLGLAIVKGFVEANGGQVRVESLPGQGTTFVVELPVPSAAGSRQEGSSG
jgi:two-component system sensor histidine kinase KdpD